MKRGSIYTVEYVVHEASVERQLCVVDVQYFDFARQVAAAARDANANAAVGALGEFLERAAAQLFVERVGGIEAAADSGARHAAAAAAEQLADAYCALHLVHVALEEARETQVALVHHVVDGDRPVVGLLRIEVAERLAVRHDVLGQIRPHARQIDRAFIKQQKTKKVRF